MNEYFLNRRLYAATDRVLYPVTFARL